MALLTDPSSWLYIPMFVSMLVIFVNITLDRLLSTKLSFRRWLIDGIAFLGLII